MLPADKNDDGYLDGRCISVRGRPAHDNSGEARYSGEAVVLVQSPQGHPLYTHGGRSRPPSWFRRRRSQSWTRSAIMSSWLVRSRGAPVSAAVPRRTQRALHTTTPRRTVLPHHHQAVCPRLARVVTAAQVPSPLRRCHRVRLQTPAHSSSGHRLPSPAPQRRHHQAPSTTTAPAAIAAPGLAEHPSPR